MSYNTLTTIKTLEAAIINSSEFCILEKETVIDAREIIKRLYAYKEGMHQLVKESKEAISGLRFQNSKLEAKVKRLLTESSKLRTALQTIQNDFEKHNQSIGNYSDGEFTQDYTTRAAMVFNALENL